jgi:hypothetical protein
VGTCCRSLCKPLSAPFSFSVGRNLSLIRSITGLPRLTCQSVPRMARLSNEWTQPSFECIRPVNNRLSVDGHILERQPTGKSRPRQPSSTCRLFGTSCALFPEGSCGITRENIHQHLNYMTLYHNILECLDQPLDQPGDCTVVSDQSTGCRMHSPRLSQLACRLPVDRTVVSQQPAFDLRLRLLCHPVSTHAFSSSLQSVILLP